MDPNTPPPALSTLAAFPRLQDPIRRSLAAQAHRVAERTARFIPRPALLRSLDERIRASAGGLITLEGPPGSGATTLLCHLAATRPYAVWLPDDDAGAGLEALCAQLLALHDLPIALVPPAAGRDATTLERLLAEAGARRRPDDPLVALIGRAPDDQTAPFAPPFPAAIPPGVVIVLASTPRARPPVSVAARLTLPARGVQLEQQLAQAAVQLGCAADVAAAVAARAQGSFLFARLASGLIRSARLDAGELPEGLGALHQVAWAQLDAAGRRLAALIAAAGEPIDLALAADLAETTPGELRRWAGRWRPFLETIGPRIRLYHPVTRAFVAAQSGDGLASAHAAYVALARARAGGRFERLSAGSDGYLVRQLSQHIALSTPAGSAGASDALATRGWIMARERASGSMRPAAQDLAWVLRAMSGASDALSFVRAAALGGTLTLLGRTLHPDAAAEAFESSIRRGVPREPTLRRVREILDQLPHGRAKALALRRLGEVCYALRMRAPAMRMLSEALDLEAPGLPRAWRDEREETLVAFARSATAIDTPQTALGITARIGHAERRGLIETEVVRWLLARGQRTRAEEVAYAIGHTAMHEWAMAEVAVGHARAGDPARSETVLSTLKTETAVAWARCELACDAARAGDPHAAGRLAPLTNASLCDRALALVAQALAAGGQHDAAIETARMADDRMVRAQALIDLALQQPPNAETALAQAAGEIVALTGDDLASLVAALAAAQATIGRLETALHSCALLPEDEERDRAQSRVAVALARRGRDADARIVADAIGDDDERDWTFDELAHLAGARCEWGDAFALAAQIVAEQQRAHTEADLTIVWARAGAAALALAQAGRIALAGERARVLIAIAGPLVGQGGTAAALAALATIHDPDQRSRYQGAVAAALAAHGDLPAARQLAGTVARPIDRARALIAIARAAIDGDRALAQQMLGEGLRIAAALGRAETFRCLDWAADTLAQLGAAELLLAAASALDEIDSWWG